MADNRYIEFIELLIDQTKANELKWSYLDENKELVRRMGWYNETVVFSEYFFNEERSFFCKIGDMNIVLLTPNNDISSALYVIPYTFRNIVVLDFKNYGEILTRLANIVVARFPNADIFITDFIRKPEREAS